jgi:gliding motility-associated-like protein
MLPGSAVALTSLDYMASYYWNTGETSQSVTVKEPGDYFVTYIDTNCCQQMDTTRIYLLDLFVPNAFSPNYDGRNDRFHVTGPTLGINDYHFYIYNRWGQLLWESDNFNDGWDGTFKGTECPVGTYAWVMNFSVSGNLLNKDKVIKRGVLTLVK